MNPTTAQPVVWGNYCNPCVAPGVFQNSAGRKLWGSNVRRSMGIAQIICGVFELGLGIAVICLPTGGYYDYVDRYAWGIWTGVFVIVTGFLGVFSLRLKCMVIAYMVCSIIAAVIGAGSCTYAGLGAESSSHELHYHDYDNTYRRANMPLYIVLCIIFFAQMVISIIGASFTCGALSCRGNQHERIVYYTRQPLLQEHVPAPPYSVHAPQNDPTFLTTVWSQTGANMVAQNI